MCWWRAAGLRGGARPLARAARGGSVGGVATGPEMAQLMVPSDVLEGASKEIWGQLIQEGFATAGNLVAFDTERWKDVALEKVLASGAEVLFHAMVAAPVREGDTIKGIIIES